jgi:hypothetical protein
VSEHLRELFADAAEPRMGDDARVGAVLQAGRELRRRRRALGALAATLLLTAGGVAFRLVALPSEAPRTALVLGCTEDTATRGARTVHGGPAGVSLSVVNTSGGVAEVVAGGTKVLALPGRSVVTLPLASGESTVRCGRGEAVRVRVPERATGACRRQAAGSDADIRSGDLAEQSRAWMGSLPPGARVVDASDDGGPLRRIQVRSHGAVMAEALWHELPGGTTWQLVALARCATPSHE